MPSTRWTKRTHRMGCTGSQNVCRAARESLLTSSHGPTLEALRARREPPIEIPLPAFNESDAAAIIENFLSRYCKNFDDVQRAALTAKKDADRPPYLLTALEELRTLGAYEEITDRIKELPDEVQPLFVWILERLEREPGFYGEGGRPIGQDAYGEVYAVAKDGLEIKDFVREGPERNEDELALLNTLGMSVMATKVFAAAELKDIYERSVEICERSGDTQRLPIALYGLWVFHIDGGRLETARGPGERILELAGRTGDVVVLVEGLYALGTTLLQLGAFRDACRHLSDAVDNYDRERHASNRFFYQLDQCATCLSSSARALWFLGCPDQALRRSKASGRHSSPNVPVLKRELPGR